MGTNEMHGITGEILLDAGTNELEVLVFELAGGRFGVNVAKVREVIKPVQLTAVPHQHPSVLGMFNIRGSVLPLVDLALHLDLRHTRGDALSNGRIVITEFNGVRCGFLVDAVDQIHRRSWKDVRPAPELGASGGSVSMSSVTGVIEENSVLVLMIDFESVADAILTERRLQVAEVANDLGVDRANARVILAEDSPFMRTLVRDTFLRCGYAKSEVFGDGEAAWRAISDASSGAPACIVSDIEMPRMDGLHLTKRVKESPQLRKIPVILFSSLITQDNLKKGAQVGADMQIAKPELAEMVRLVDRALAGKLDQRTISQAA